MNATDIVNRHIGKNEFIDLKNEDGTIDKLGIAPLDMAKYPLLMEASKYFENFDENKLKEMSKDDIKTRFDGFEETMSKLLDLCVDRIMKANPELIDKEKVRLLSENNFPVIIEKMAEMGSMSARDAETKKKSEFIKGRSNGNAGIPVEKKDSI